MQLFSPIQIRGMSLRNRILMAPMLTNFGYGSSRGIAFLEARAKGGVGGIIAYGIPPDLMVYEKAWKTKERKDAFIEGIKKLTKQIHQHQTKVGVQLWHGNRYPAVIKGNFEAGEWVAPSSRIEGFPPHMAVVPSAHLREMTIQEIEALIQTYGKAAAKAKEVGFDFVEFHGAHSYLANQFFSPADNHRMDLYGGNLNSRMRFGIECIKAIREAVGEDYPIFYRFPAEESRPGGITLSDSFEYAAELKIVGVDVLNVSIGTSNDKRGVHYYITPPHDRPAGTYVHFAEVIKRRVSILVSAVGRISSPALAESIIEDKQADLVTVGRQLIADPEWPNKIFKGEVEDIRPCLSCCECEQSATSGRESRCAVNAMVGKEKEYTMQPAAKKKKVVVIGGGPAGMEAATTASLRGHKVILFEKENKLGGQLLVSCIPPYKEAHAHLNKYLMRQLNKSGAEVRLGWDTEIASVKNENPDTVVLAIGASPTLPTITGVEKPNVISALEVLCGKKEAGEKAIIIGGGMIGLETAEWLSTMGKKVIVLEMLEEVGQDAILVLAEALKERLKKARVEIKVKAQAIEITSFGVRVKEGEKEIFCEGDSVILACGMKATKDMINNFMGKGFKEIYSVGDCVEPRRIRFAIEEGFCIGHKI